MKYKLVMFDFDGTLADSFQWLLNFSDHLAEKYHIKKIDRKDVDMLRSCDANKMIQLFQVPLWKIPLMARDVRSSMQREIEQIPLFGGVDQVFQTLGRLGIPIAIVSTNSYENIVKVLGPNAPQVKYYECGISIFGKHQKIQKVLTKSGVPAHEAILIGDEIRDGEAANASRVAFGAVSWGYARPDVLATQKPRELFLDMDDLLKKIT